MSTDLFDRYAALDPARAPEALRDRETPDAPVLLAAIDERKIEMETDQIPATTTDADRRRGGLLVAAAAFAAAVLVGVALLLARSAGETPTATAPTTAAPEAATAPIDVARAFIEARNAYDGETAESLFVPDTEITFEFASNPSMYPALAEFERVTGWTLLFNGCTENVPSFLSCSYRYENALTRALDVGPFTGDMQLRVVDGKIEQLSGSMVQSTEYEVFEDQVLTVFWTWLEANHPNDRRVMWDGTKPSLSPESIALWEQYTNEFVASVKAS